MAGEKKRWQQILGNFSPDDKKRVMRVLNITPSTLSRWINGQQRPVKSQDIVKLANEFPMLKEALEEEFPNAFKGDYGPPTETQIPSTYYDDVLDSLEKTEESQREYDIINDVFEKIVSQLDPSGDGLLLIFMKCVEPGDDTSPITRLRSEASYGTGVWNFQQIQKPYEAGLSSLVGQALTTGRIALYPQNPTLNYAASVIELEAIKSGAAFPIRRSGYIAGVLFVGSIYDAFFTNARRSLLAKYAKLFSLSLPDHQFYPRQRILLESLDCKEVSRAE